MDRTDQTLSTKNSIVPHDRESVANAYTGAPPEGAEPKYQGISIDEQFPVFEHFSRIDPTPADGDSTVALSGYTINFQKFAPRTIKKGLKTIFTFGNKFPRYWGSVIGVSNLLGPTSKQIFVATSGPGGVCCTNYHITDVSGSRPRNIFRSEDFGRFRGTIEIFDGDGDGVYELVQLDSCFRYFMDDCGTCSPEPRAVFEYDRQLREYRPAGHIQQGFVKEEMGRTEKWIEDQTENLKTDAETGDELRVHRTVLALVVDLLHIGEEKRAWRIFKKYAGDHTGAIRREINKRLAGCKFYQTLKRTRNKRHALA